MADPTTDPRTDSPTEAPVGESVAPPEAGWVTLASPEIDGASEPPLRMRRIVSQLLVGVLLVLIAVTVGGTLAARRLAEREAVNDAANTADVLAESVVQPVPDRPAPGRRHQVGRGVRRPGERAHPQDDDVVRVKLWGKDGTIIYSDQPELIGQTFPLEAEEREVLDDPRTVAEISDLNRTENTLDRKIGNKLVEVYRPVWTPERHRGTVRDLHAVRPGQPAHRPALAGLRRRHAEQPAPVRRAARTAAVAPPAARTTGAAAARAPARTSRRRLRHGAPADRGDPARRTGAGPGGDVVRDRRGLRAGAGDRPDRGRRRAGVRVRVRAHQHPGPALAAGRHLPGQPRAGRARRRARRPRPVGPGAGTRGAASTPTTTSVSSRTRNAWSTGWPRRRCATRPSTRRRAR